MARVADEWRIFRGTPDAEAARREYEANLPAQTTKPADDIVEAAWLRELCLRHGVDDVGFVEVSRPGLGKEGENARFMMPEAKSMISLVARTNPVTLRVPARSAASAFFHHTNHKLDSIAAELCLELARHGIRATAPTAGFAMEMAPQPGKPVWLLAHKYVAVEAGVGHMGTNRNVIHPRFGNFLLLNTVIIDREIDEYDKPLDYNPCFGCNLCVAACPVGAIRTDDHFDFFACMTHNYREFPQSAFDWVEALTMEGGPAAYRSKFRDTETASWVQSMEFEPTYKSAYCMAVCPAGDEYVGSYLDDPAKHRDTVLKPLREYPEAVYVTSGTRSEQRALRNPHKVVRYVDYKPDLSTPQNFAVGLRHMFRSPGPDAPRRVVAFRFPDGTVTAVMAKGKLTTTTEEPSEAADATVACEAANYITILHKHKSDRMRNEVAQVTIEGDVAAFESLYGCLD